MNAIRLIFRGCTRRHAGQQPFIHHQLGCNRNQWISINWKTEVSNIRNYYISGSYSLNNNISCQVKILLKLAENNKSREIYTILNNLNCSTTFKGNVFENFLAELYQKIGWDTKVVGGKNDKGADILLFNSKQKVHAIIQVKNTKRPVSKKEIVNECDNFIGIYNPGTAKKYTCDTLMIFSLNGYTKGAWNYNYPATHKIFRYEWSYIESLIQFYANSF
ncbi:MAG TPA: restriction endonuclease, partial [Thioploca sp.]|nr:restriction endonuclease [Thioploca sp.]